MKRTNRLTIKKIKEKIRKNETLFVIGALLIVSTVILLVLPTSAYAASWTDRIGVWVLQATAFLFQFFIGLFAVLTSYVAVIFDWVAGFRVFSEGVINEGLLRGWSLLVNVANLVFILIFLFIGVATIFRVKQFSVRTLFIRIIVAVLLINFSFFFTRVIVDTADAVQNIFATGAVTYPKCKTAPSPIGCTLGNLVNIGDLNWKNSNTAASKLIAETMDIKQGNTTVAMRLAIESAYVAIFFAVFFFTLTTLTVLLIVRMVVLWVLAVISPFAYVAMILPATRKYSGEFWNNLWNWALLGPLTLILLNVAILVLSPMQDPSYNFGDNNVGNGYNLVGTTKQVGLLIVAVIFMLGSLWMAKRMGGSIAAAITDRGSSWAKGVGKWAGGRAVRAGKGAAGVVGGAARLGGLGALAAARRTPGIGRVVKGAEGVADLYRGGKQAIQQAGTIREEQKAQRTNEAAAGFSRFMQKPGLNKLGGDVYQQVEQRQQQQAIQGRVQQLQQQPESAEINLKRMKQAVTDNNSVEFHASQIIAQQKGHFGNTGGNDSGTNFIHETQRAEASGMINKSTAQRQVGNIQEGVTANKQSRDSRQSMANLASSNKELAQALKTQGSAPSQPATQNITYTTQGGTTTSGFSSGETT